MDRRHRRQIPHRVAERSFNHSAARRCRYILERRLFDYELAKIAVQAGAEVVTKAYVHDLLRDNDGIVGVRALVKEEPVDIRARIVIGADGVESRVGKWAGIDTTCHIHDMESCAQVTVGGVDVEQDVLDLSSETGIAPGGYVWVFPKVRGLPMWESASTWSSRRKNPPFSTLRNTWPGRFPSASILTRIAGGVPCAKTLDRIVSGNVLLVGDAAHQVNPVSGGGIISGMIGGMMAGAVSAEAIRQGRPRSSGRVREAVAETSRRRHEVFYTLKEAILVPFGRNTQQNG